MAAKTKPRRSSTSSPSAASRLAEFARFCAELRTENGAPLQLHGFQKAILRSYFEGARETAVLLPKKNGKSTLMAALALYHLVVTPNAECIIVAASREQAELILLQARKLIHSSTSLKRHVHVLQRSILSTSDEGRIRVLAADADTADGTIPTLAIVDELHRQRSLDLYGVLRDGLGARDGQLITISTAGASAASPLGQLRARAHAYPGLKRVGKHNHVSSPDGAFAFHEWCLGPDDDPNDMRTVKAANPLPSKTVEQLQEFHDSPTQTTYGWLRFHCGVWTEGAEPWIDPAKWDALTGDVSGEGESVLGVRVGPGHQEAALVRVVKTEERLEVHHRILTELPDAAPLAAVEEEVREAWEAEPPRLVAYTSTTFRRSAEILEAEGVEIIEVPYTPVRMMQVSETLLKLIEEGRLRHDGDPDLRAQVLAARTKQTERGWRFSEEQGQAPISALLALAIAADLIESEPEAPEVVFAFT